MRLKPLENGAMLVLITLAIMGAGATAYKLFLLHHGIEVELVQLVKDAPGNECRKGVNAIVRDSKDNLYQRCVEFKGVIER